MKKILIIEDDTDLNELLCELISNIPNLEIFSALDAASSKDKIRTINPDIIISDIKLPDGDGVEVAQWAKDKGFFPKYLYFFSGQNSYPKDFLQSLGADEIFCKPSELNSLLSKIKAIV